MAASRWSSEPVNIPTLVAFLISVLALSVPLFVDEKWLWLLVVFGNSLFGLIATRRGWESAWLVVHISIAALSGIPGLLALAATMSGLAFWDLTSHHRVLTISNEIFNVEQLKRSNYRSLAIALIVGGSLGVIAIGVPLRLSFASAMLLALLALGGIAVLAEQARSASN